MLEWLKANMNWLFDGIGVYLIGAIVAVVAWFVPRVRKFFYGLYLKVWPNAEQNAEQTVAGPVDEKVISAKEKIAKAMDQINILFIDDDVRFKVVGILQNAGWKNTSIVKDIASLDEPIVQRADILFIDINGVGKKLRFRDEGLGLTQALKERYPDKTVIIYSATTLGERFHSAWRKADNTIAKNADPYEFQQLIEEYALSHSHA